MAIKAGMATTVICGYGRDSWSRTHSSEEARVKNQTTPDDQLPKEFAPEYGYFGAVAAHAFGATRHMHLYGTTRDQFGDIAVAFREHALRNPDAQMKKPLTKAQYHEAPQIVSPFGLYDCSLRSDGAGAVIVTSQRTRPRPQAAAGADQGVRQLQQSARLVQRRQHGGDSREEERRDRLQHGGPRPGRCRLRADLRLLHLHGAHAARGLRLLQEGRGRRPFVASGALRMDGRLPTNTSGGQLSEAHVEGMLQVVEGARQMRHTYPAERQVKDAEIALVSGHGGNQVCHSTLILGRA